MILSGIDTTIKTSLYQNTVTIISKLIKEIGEGINLKVTDGIKPLFIIFLGYIQLTRVQVKLTCKDDMGQIFLFLIREGVDGHLR